MSRLLTPPSYEPPPPAGPMQGPFLRAPERAKTIYLVTAGAACGPLLAGVVIFGWRSAMVTAISILSCMLFERLYYRVTKTPALLGRSHSALTGLLVGLTLPAYAPWYMPVIAAAFAIIVGKAIFGGEGHFLWQPALVGRLAVAVLSANSIIPGTAESYWPAQAPAAPVLTPRSLVTGDIRDAARPQRQTTWRNLKTVRAADAALVLAPADKLAPLTRDVDYTPWPYYGALAWRPDGSPPAAPAALLHVEPINQVLYGARPGAIGETCIVVIVVAGLYLVYRNYVRWQLPGSFILAAVVVAAVAPVRLAADGGGYQLHWFPGLIEGTDVGALYVMYQLCGGAIVLSAFFLATEMTSRPVTAGGQVIFGTGCGVLAMLLQLYVGTEVSAYLAVLAMNTFTPVIDSLGRPRVLGQKRSDWLLGRLLPWRHRHSRRSAMP